MTHLFLAASANIATLTLFPAVANASANSSAQDTAHHLLTPGVGLVGLGILVITGAIAVIREIRLENKDQ